MFKSFIFWNILNISLNSHLTTFFYHAPFFLLGGFFDTLFCYLIHVQVASNIRSCTHWRSDMEQNYLGVLGIIWTAGWDFPIIGFCDTVLWHSVAGMISDDVEKLESGEWRVKTSVPPTTTTCLSTVNPTWYVLHCLFFSHCFLALHCSFKMGQIVSSLS